MKNTKVITHPQKTTEDIPHIDEAEKKEETPKQKKPAGKRSEPVFDPQKAFLDAFRKLTYRHRAWDAWHDFIIMFACALSNAVDKEHYNGREALYLETIQKYNKQEQELFPELLAQTVLALEKNPEQDFLGSIFMSSNLGNEFNGQFFTPYHVCELMAEMTMDGTVQTVEQNGYISVNDPCCGAGATLIAAIHAARKRLEKANINYQNHVLVAAQDIDMTVALMCYIQLSLLGVAGYVKIGNSITDPITDKDSYENYWFTPMYFSPVWTMRRLFSRPENGTVNPSIQTLKRLADEMRMKLRVELVPNATSMTC